MESGHAAAEATPIDGGVAPIKLDEHAHAQVSRTQMIQILTTVGAAVKAARQEQSQKVASGVLSQEEAAKIVSLRYDAVEATERAKIGCSMEVLQEAVMLFMADTEVRGLNLAVQADLQLAFEGDSGMTATWDDAKIIKTLQDLASMSVQVLMETKGQLLASGVPHPQVQETLRNACMAPELHAAVSARLGVDAEELQANIVARQSSPAVLAAMEASAQGGGGLVAESLMDFSPAGVKEALAAGAAAPTPGGAGSAPHSTLISKERFVACMQGDIDAVKAQGAVLKAKAAEGALTREGAKEALAEWLSEYAQGLQERCGFSNTDFQRAQEAYGGDAEVMGLMKRLSEEAHLASQVGEAPPTTWDEATLLGHIAALGPLLLASLFELRAGLLASGLRGEEAKAAFTNSMQGAAMGLMGAALKAAGLEQEVFDHHMFHYRESPAVAEAMMALGSTGTPGSGPDADKLWDFSPAGLAAAATAAGDLMTREQLLEASAYMRDETAAMLAQLRAGVESGAVKPGDVPAAVQEHMGALGTRVEERFGASTTRLGAAQSVHGEDAAVAAVTKEVRALVGQAMRGELAAPETWNIETTVQNMCKHTAMMCKLLRQLAAAVKSETGSAAEGRTFFMQAAQSEIQNLHTAAIRRIGLSEGDFEASIAAHAGHGALQATSEAGGKALQTTMQELVGSF